MLYAYVDETGDRGSTAKSSRYFAMAGMVIAAEVEARMRAAVARCRAMLGVPDTSALHWKNNVRSWARRQAVAAEFAALPGVVVNFVVLEKAAIPAASPLLNDQVQFYNYAAGLMVERILLTAQFWPGGARPVAAKFGHVRGFDHAKTLSHFDNIKQEKDPHGMPWSLLHGNVRFAPSSQWAGLQGADMYAGMLHKAVVPDEYGGHEQHHLLNVRHQIRRHSGLVWGAGFKMIATKDAMRSLPWLPDLERLPQRQDHEERGPEARGPGRPGASQPDGRRKGLAANLTHPRDLSKAPTSQDDTAYR